MFRACSKREIKIIANQRKEIELDFVGNVKFLYAEGVFIKKKKTKMHISCCYFSTPKSSISVSLQNEREKSTQVGGFC